MSLSVLSTKRGFTWCTQAGNMKCLSVGMWATTALHLQKEHTVRWLGLMAVRGAPRPFCECAAAGSTSVGSVAEVQSLPTGDGTRTGKNKSVVSEFTEGT